MKQNVRYCAVAVAPATAQGEEKIYSPKILKIVDDIKDLRLHEVADLNELLKVSFGGDCNLYERYYVMDRPMCSVKYTMPNKTRGLLQKTLNISDAPMMMGVAQAAAAAPAVSVQWQVTDSS